MKLQTIQSLNGKAEYVLLPITVYQALKEEIEEELKAQSGDNDLAADCYVPFELTDYVENPVALARIKARITQGELARRMGVSQAYISKVEQRDRVTPETAGARTPGAERVVRDGQGVKPRYLFVLACGLVSSPAFAQSISIGLPSWLVPLGVAVFVLLLLAAVIAKLKQKGKSEGFPYIKNHVLFSPAERSFLGVLDQAIGDRYRIFGKVRVADIASVKSMSDRSTWQRAFNRINAKHFDFVLCDKDDLSIAAAIELDDQSHQQRKRQERDDFLVGLCQAISLPMIQVPAKRGYSVFELRAQVLDALGIRKETGPATEIPSRPIGVSVETQQAIQESDAPLCPKCSRPMVHRQTKSGANAGKAFWGCGDFPKCRGIVPIIAGN